MFAYNGGIYKEKPYSTLYDVNEKYSDTSRDGNYYFHSGIISEHEDEERAAILVFDKNTDRLVYAEEMPEYNEFKGEYAKQIEIFIEYMKRIQENVLNTAEDK